MAPNYLHQLRVMCVFITAEVALTHRDTPLLLDAHLWIIPAGDAGFFFFPLRKKNPKLFAPRVKRCICWFCTERPQPPELQTLQCFTTVF